MHDRNIENRTNMRLLDEVQAMEQKLKTFKLDKEQARTEKSKSLNLSVCAVGIYDRVQCRCATGIYNRIVSPLGVNSIRFQIDSCHPVLGIQAALISQQKLPRALLVEGRLNEDTYVLGQKMMVFFTLP